MCLGLPALAACTSTDEPSPAAPSASTGSTPYVVHTAAGDVRGIASGDTVAWRGIPYAAPPVGDLRWRPPRPAEPWDGVRAAAEYGPACPQSSDDGLGIGSEPEQTAEDCLTLNVLRPEGGQDRLPVMVWVHGGAFAQGSGGQELYNSPALVRRGVVLVTVNYRLGRLGFFAHPELAAEGRGERVANFGLLDQIAALEWVRDHIEGFGGDPENVTVFGESAGGMSVNALMASPRARGLFHRAISQSGLGREPSRSWAEAVADGAERMDEAGLPDDSAAELRSIPAARVAALPLSIVHGDAPVRDDVLPRGVAETFARGAEAPVPYLTGTTDLEWPDLFLERSGMDPTAVRAAVLDDDATAAVRAYGDADELARHLVSDVLFTEPARHLATLHARKAPTWRYRFSAAAPQLVDTLGGAPHTAELPYVFGATEQQPFPVAGDQALADRIGDYWVAFARTGDPNHDDARRWPAAAGGSLLDLTAAGPRPVRRDPWRARLDLIARGYTDSPTWSVPSLP